MSEQTPLPRSYAPQGAVVDPGPLASDVRTVGGDVRDRESSRESVRSALRSAVRNLSSAAPRRDDAEYPETSAAPTSATPASAASPGTPRRVRLSVSRVDPWSVMKLGFLLAIAIGIMTVIAAAVLWFVLDGMHVFSSLNKTVTEVAGDESLINILDYVEFGRVMSLATLVAVINVVLLTALATIGTFLYNIVAALVGGVHLTLTDE